MKRILVVLMLMLTLTISAVFSAGLAAISAGGSIPPEVTQHAKDWPLPNRDYGNTRFTADATINSSNVGNLKLEWSFKIPGIGAYGGGASNPIIMGNNIYFQDLKANVFSLNLAGWPCKLGENLQDLSRSWAKWPSCRLGQGFCCKGSLYDRCSELEHG